MKKEILNRNIKGNAIQYLINNKVLLVVLIILFIFAMNSISLAKEIGENKITKDFKISSSVSVNGVTQYGVYNNQDSENINLTIKIENYNLPVSLYGYRKYIRLRITYSQENNKIYDCKVVNYQTGKIIKDLSDENLYKLFSIEYGKNIIEKDMVDNIKLSELKENEIYKYTANSETGFIEIENDIKRNCIVYIKENNDIDYMENINVYKKIERANGMISDPKQIKLMPYDPGETFSVFYREIENKEIAELVEDKVIFLSEYNDGEELTYGIKKYIYNDTDKEIEIHIKDKLFKPESSEPIILEKDGICGFSWIIDSVSISYVDNNSNKEQKDNTENKQSSENLIEDNVDEYTVSEKNNIDSIVVFVIAVICLIGGITILLIARKRKQV